MRKKGMWSDISSIQQEWKYFEDFTSLNLILNLNLFFSSSVSEE
jgi:hypothetical protein